MAYHLLLKNNTVSLSQPVKRKQSQNRENMRDNSFLTYDERQAAFSKNFNGVLTNFLQILQCTLFFELPFTLSGYRFCYEKKEEKTWGCTFEWGLEMKQYSNATGQRVFALYMLFQVPIWRPFWKCENRSYPSCQLVWFPLEVWVHNYASR